MTVAIGIDMQLEKWCAEDESIAFYIGAFFVVLDKNVFDQKV